MSDSTQVATQERPLAAIVDQDRMLNDGSGHMAWNVRLVQQGQRYGLNDCLVHDDARPLIEFFDPRFTELFGEPGQFVSRYYVQTLQKDLARLDRGLLLDTGSDEWVLSRSALLTAVQWAENTLGKERMAAEDETPSPGM